MVLDRLDMMIDSNVSDVLITGEQHVLCNLRGGCFERSFAFEDISR